LGVEAHLASGGLVPLFTDWQDERFPIYAFYPSRQYLPPKTRAFLEFLSGTVLTSHSAQRLCAQVVFLVHQLVPDSRVGAVGTVNAQQTDRLQGLQGRLDRGGLQSRRLGSNTLGPRNRALIDLRQSQQPAAMQLQQRHSTTDFLELAQSCAPIQPSADHPRQNPSGKSGLFIEGLLNAFENIRAKFLTAGLHTGRLEDRYSLCSAKNVGHVQSFRGEDVGAADKARNLAG
jgi:hypothetical protein